MKDSPVNVLLKELIHFDKTSATSVYIQISQQIINAIQRRYLKDGSALPGTRIFSQLLNIHRNTAVAVVRCTEPDGEPESTAIFDELSIL